MSGYFEIFFSNTSSHTIFIIFVFRIQEYIKFIVTKFCENALKNNAERLDSVRLGWCAKYWLYSFFFLQMIIDVLNYLIELFHGAYY